MPRQPNPIPSYRLHKKTGRAVVTVRDHLGDRRDILLPGQHGSDESRQEYERVCAQLRAAGGRLRPDKQSVGDLTVIELILRYVREHVESYYLDAGGSPTSEQQLSAAVPTRSLSAAARA